MKLHEYDRLIKSRPDGDWEGEFGVDVESSFFPEGDPLGISKV